MAKGMLKTATDFINAPLGLGNAHLDFAGAAFFIDALEFQILANDPPDPDYTVIPTPNPPPIPALPTSSCLTPTTSPIFNDLVQNQVQTIGLAQAAQTAFDRATSAFNNNAFNYVQQQTDAGTAYTTQAEANVLNITSDITTLSQTFPQGCIPTQAITVSDITTFQQNGFSPDLVSLLEEFGLNAGDIAQLTQLIDAEDPQALSGLFPDLLANDVNELIAGDPLAPASPAVPEPSGALILCVGLFGLGLLRCYSFSPRKYLG
jgi:hypothetical protein